MLRPSGILWISVPFISRFKFKADAERRHCSSTFSMPRLCINLKLWQRFCKAKFPSHTIWRLVSICLYPGLSALNIMGLHSPQSAVLSAIIYNALIIIALIPLALKGVKYREVSAGKLLSRNLLIYGLGGLVAPFIFVKLIDVLLVMTGLV